MSDKFSIIKIAGVAIALGCAFLVGRASKNTSVENTQTARSATRVQAKSARRATPPASRTGAGSRAVSSTAAIRDIFKEMGYDRQRSSAEVVKVLDTMSVAEVGRLVRNLAEEQANTPGYFHSMEIQLACTRWAEIDPQAALAFALSSKQASFRDLAINSIFPAVAKADFEYAWSMLSQVKDPGVHQSVRKNMITYVAVSRPDVWLREVNKDPSLIQGHQLPGIISEWAINDPKVAAARIDQLPKNFAGIGVSAVATVWAGKNPQAATAWAQSLKNDRLRDQAIGAVAAGIAAQDPDAALTMTSSLQGSARERGVYQIFQTLSDRDLKTAMARAEALGDERDRAAALKAILGISPNPGSPYSFHHTNHSSKFSAEQMKQVILRLPNGTLRSQAIATMANKLIAYPSKDTDLLLEDFPEKERIQAKWSIIERIHYNNPQRALEMYKSLPENGSKSYYLGSILSNLAKQKPLEVLEYALSTKNTGAASQGVTGAFRHLGASDPAEAIRHFSELPEGGLKNQALTSLVSSWASQDTDAALHWADSLEGKQRTAAICGVLPMMAQNQPQKAADIITTLAATNDPNATRQTVSATRSLVRQWAIHDPKSAAKWAEALPQSSIKSTAYTHITEKWISQDLQQASKWIEAEPNDKLRDIGTQKIVYHLQSTDPDSAFQWASNITSSHQRRNMLRSVVQTWKNSKPDAARTAIEQSKLTEEERAYLFKMLK